MVKTSRRTDQAIAENIEKAGSCLDRQELVQLASRLVDISSPTGEEGPCASFLVDYMKSMGLEAFYQEIGEGRGNAVGRLKGSKEGPCLIFNGHLDTSFTGREEEDYAALGPLEAASLPKARVDKERIYGLGIYNMKGGLATSVIAVKAIKDAGIPLKGDILITGVAGEVEKCPVQGAVKSYRGPLYMGASIGTEWLLKHGITGDFVINGEPTDLRVNWENGGYVWFKVQTRGKATYVIRKPYGVNAILEAVKVIEAVEGWAAEYTEAHASELARPQVMVGAIESGWPYKPSTCPAICNLYVDVRMAPGQEPGATILEFARVMDKLTAKEKDLVLNWEPYLLARGERTDPDNPYVKRCLTAYEKVTGEAHQNCLPEQASAWTDCNVFRGYGIPAVSIGPGAGTPPAAKEAGLEMQFARGEHQRIEDMMSAARIHIAAALDICLRSKEELSGG
jgi:acetylornithine deacetylase/succinyl-diaminopimelate desuccinylase-like protein